MNSAMRNPLPAELASIALLLHNGTLTSRAAVLVTLLGFDTDACQMGPLASALGLSVPRVSMLGYTMVKDGLVDRCVPASDLRKTALALTPIGRAAASGHLAMLRLFSLAGEETIPPSGKLATGAVQLPARQKRTTRTRDKL